MALHTPTPTLDTLTVEGLKMAGYPSAAAGDTNQVRAEEWVQEMFADIRITLNGGKLNPVMVTSYGVTTAGVSRYASPSDLEKIQSVSILDGDAGTATAVTASQVTLAADAPSPSVGQLILLTSGTGIGNASQISSYTASTKVAEVTPNFTGASYDGTEGYLVCSAQYNLEQMSIRKRDMEESPYTTGLPEMYYPVGQGNADSDETGEFQLYPVPSKTYGIQLRYYANLNLVDLNSDANLLGTLYRRWQNIFVQKVMYKMLKTDRDERANNEEQLYWLLLGKMIAKETYGHNLNDIQMVATDYDGGY